MIRKWLLASLASGLMAMGMVGCGEEAPPPADKPKPTSGTVVKPDTSVKPDTATKPATATKPDTSKDVTK
ncbi:MAG TPA: hypothetical protein VNE39_05890 [Planctomycetota bacterium]|nr:hypothetical protein [Planctomycetota bacterium]